MAGCTALDEQIRRLGSAVHVFGHSHINCDRVIDGVRYIQNALKYPKDRKQKTPTFPLKLVWNTREPLPEQHAVLTHSGGNETELTETLAGK